MRRLLSCLVLLIVVFATKAQAQGLITNFLGSVLGTSRTTAPPAIVSPPIAPISPAAVEVASPSPVAPAVPPPQNAREPAVEAAPQTLAPAPSPILVPPVAALSLPPVSVAPPASVRPANSPPQGDQTPANPSSKAPSPAAPSRPSSPLPQGSIGASVAPPVLSLDVEPPSTGSPQSIDSSLAPANAATNAALAPVRVSTKANRVVTNTNPSESTKCGQDEYKLIYRYYLSNKELHDECSAAAGGYLFPFSGPPTPDQAASMANSEVCMLLLSGVSQVLPLDCQLGGMAVRAAAAEIIRTQTKLKATTADIASSMASDEVSLVASEATDASSASPVGTVKAGNLRTSDVKLSSDLKIISGWQDAPAHGARDTAASIHADLHVSQSGDSAERAKPNEQVHALADTSAAAGSLGVTGAMATFIGVVVFME